VVKADREAEKAMQQVADKKAEEAKAAAKAKDAADSKAANEAKAAAAARPAQQQLPRWAEERVAVHTGDISGVVAEASAAGGDVILPGMRPGLPQLAVILIQVRVRR
jgi:hypothetical protein